MSVFSAMSPALATIFSFEKSRKWIIREGLTGISRSGSGAPIACGWKKSLGFLKLLLGSCSDGTRLNLFEHGAGLPPARGRKLPAYRGNRARQHPGLGRAPRGTVPPLLSELEARIDEALVIARASEEGVREVGEMALDAARQARRAAEAAEGSAAGCGGGVEEAARPAGPVAGGACHPCR